MATSNNKNKRKRKQRKIPTTAELMMGCRSPVALAAILRSGGGKHQDKRRSRKTQQANKAEWQRQG
ncbi:MAG: hypothetical protein WC761_02270 [Candidatus Paceibacterota bacterium]|jgi:hypothetical protein